MKQTLLLRFGGHTLPIFPDKSKTMNTLRSKHLVVIGAGNIGRILLKRLGEAGVPAENLVVCDSDTARGLSAAAQFGVRAGSLTDETTCSADVLLITTPPKAAAEVIQALTGRLHAGQMIVSFTAAVPLDQLEAMVPDDVIVVRVMPNAPSLVGQGMNPVAFGEHITPEARELVSEILATLGEMIIVRDQQMNWCVGLSGAAMRSVLPVLEGMTQAGLEAGLSESDARRVAAHVMLGTATLALKTDLKFDELKALTPMETVNEALVSQLFREAAHTAKEKMDTAQRKLWETRET